MLRLTLNARETTKQFSKLRSNPFKEIVELSESFHASEIKSKIVGRGFSAVAASGVVSLVLPKEVKQITTKFILIFYSITRLNFHSV